MKTFNGHFDGKVIVLDEPSDLKPNTKVKIIAATGQGDSGLAAGYTVLSEPVFEKIWNNPLDANYDALRDAAGRQYPPEDATHGDEFNL